MQGKNKGLLILFYYFCVVLTTNRVKASEVSAGERFVFREEVYDRANNLCGENPDFQQGLVNLKFGLKEGLNRARRFGVTQTSHPQGSELIDKYATYFCMNGHARKGELPRVPEDYPSSAASKDFYAAKLSVPDTIGSENEESSGEADGTWEQKQVGSYLDRTLSSGQIAIFFLGLSIGAALGMKFHASPITSAPNQLKVRRPEL